SEWFGLRCPVRISRQSPSPCGAHSLRRRRPTLERLDSRTLPAVVPVFTPATGLLTITGDAANDTVTVSSDAAGNIRLGGAAAAGSPRLSNTRTVVVNGGAGDDTINLSSLLGFAGSVTIDGSYGNDTLTGSPGNDLMQGYFGDDYMDGGGGNDTLYAYYGNDV